MDGRLHAWIERDASGRYQSRFPRAQASSQLHHQHDLQLLPRDRGGRLRPQPRRSPADAVQQPRADRRRTAEARDRRARLQHPRRALAAAATDGEASDEARGEVGDQHGGAVGVRARWRSCWRPPGRPLSIHEMRRALIGTADPHPGPSGRTSTQLGYGYLNTAPRSPPLAASGWRKADSRRSRRSTVRRKLAADSVQQTPIPVEDAAEGAALDHVEFAAPPVLASELAEAAHETSSGQDAEDDDELDELETVEDEIDTPVMWEDVQEALEAINEMEG